MLKNACMLMIALAATTAMTACHSPSGGFMSHTGGSHTYVSTERMQKTITVIDTRSGEPVFSIDIPVGKQLTMDFDEGMGDDPVNTPDLLRYEIWDAGTRFGRLRNSITVPNASSRIIEVQVRQDVKYAAGSPRRVLRTDEVADRPSWWTPEGGPMPADSVVEMYDN